MTKKTTKKRFAVKAAKATTFEIDIAQEFKDVKKAIFSLKDDLNEWKAIFNTQLEKLNTNMEHVLSKIADHEGRISKLETDSLKTQTLKLTMSEMAKFGWMVAKVVFCAGAVVGALGGCGLIFKILFGN